MNDSVAGNEQKRGGEEAPSARRSPWWRVTVRITAASLFGFVALATVHQMTYEPRSDDGTYEWTLRWPGPQPGAKFETHEGDDIRTFLSMLLADTGADWRVPLAEEGTIDIELSHPAYPSLWTVVRWRVWGSVDLQPAERVLLTVRVREASRTPARYDVVRIGRNGKEAVAESFHEFPEAQNAVLDALAQAMEEFQT